MRIVIAPDSFGGTLSAAEAGEAIESGWRARRATDDLVVLPMSDGGPGFIDSIAAGLNRSGPQPQTYLMTVTGPRGGSVPATILTHQGVAFCESAQACGLHLVPARERDPWTSTSRGLGELILAARDIGASRIVIGLGGTSTVDAGAGILGALGARALNGLGRDASPLLLAGPGGFGDIASVEIAGAIAACTGVELVVAADVDVPLLGPAGAARGFGAQKFADPHTVEEETLRRLATAVEGFCRVVPVDAGLCERAGAGAAGGLGWALMCLGAQVVPGHEVVAAQIGLVDAVAGADLVITGEGKLDWQSRRGKVVTGVAAVAAERGIPVVAIAGRVDLGGRELASLGIVEAWSLADRPGGLTRAMISAHAALTDAAAHVATQWSGRG